MSESKQNQGMAEDKAVLLPETPADDRKPEQSRTKRSSRGLQKEMLCYSLRTDVTTAAQYSC